MTKIDCLIIDDEPNAGKLLEDYIGKVPYLHVAGKCFDALDALEFLSHSQAGLLFLDINMPLLSGIELVNMLPQGQRIIFTTAYSEYAIQSYEYNVVDYLLKPISFNRFMMAVNKAVKLINEDHKMQAVIPPPTVNADEFLFVKSDKKMIRISLKEVFYFEGLKEYVCIHTKTQKIIIYKRMKELVEKLPAHFTRIHNSYIINSHHIAKIEANYVLIDNKSLPIGISFREAFDAFIRSRAL